ncbi:MAG: RNA polymerase sigma factor, partial [Asticcacaulis sp.]|nr:RNA polymerase sigma factor [Asticcacaulis sp.]
MLTALPDQAVVAWVSANVIPYEAELRQRLRRICASTAEVDDLVQDVYCRLLKMETVAHVGEPRAFLMQIAKNIIIDRLRRDAIVHIYAVADLDELAVADSGPSPERVALARSELKWVLGMVAHLPERCRQVFRARKIQGLSQHDTALSLGVSENIVEKETIRG